MYQFNKALVRQKGVASRWSEQDLSAMTLSSIFSTYSSVYLFLHESVMNIDVVVDFISYRGQLSANTATLTAYLASLGNTALATTTNYPTLKSNRVRYVDAIHADYSITIGDRAYGSGVELSEGDERDAILKKEGLDMTLFEKNCLVSVNGLLHRIDASAASCLILDANTSRKISQRNEIGIYSFFELGGLEYHGITEDMIVAQTPTTKLASRALIKLPKSSDGYTVGISIGGYFHLLDSEIFELVSDTVGVVRFENIRMMDRYYDSVDLIDLSSLGLVPYDRNDRLIDQVELYSDAVLRKYLTLSQSFLIYVKNDDIFKTYQHVSHTKTDGISITPLKPDYPMRDHTGRLVEYWYTVEKKFYRLAYEPRFRNNYLDRTGPDTIMPGLVDSRYSRDPVWRSNTYFMEIGSDI